MVLYKILHWCIFFSRTFKRKEKVIFSIQSKVSEQLLAPPRGIQFKPRSLYCTNIFSY